MGLYDTIILSTPINCVKCGNPIKKFQTKAFENALNSYRIGDVVNYMCSSRVISGILEDGLYCRECESFDQLVYMVIYHMILIGVCGDKVKAHQKLREMNRADLIALYGALRQRKKLWKAKYKRLHYLVDSYRSYLHDGQIESTDLMDCLQAKEVLTCILKKVRQEKNQIDEREGSQDLNKDLDKADILDLYYELHKQMDDWRRKFSGLCRLIGSYQEYLNMSEEEREKRRSSAFGALAFHDIEECLKREDVLGCLLEEAEKGRGWPFFGDEDLD